MHKDLTTFDIVDKLPNRVLDNLEHDFSLPTIQIPFDFSIAIDDTELVEFKDITFIDTIKFSPAAEYFRKHGKYTDLHPIYDKSKYDAFWDEEERRRKEGYTRPCALVKRKDGLWVKQNLHITGEHYGYLNYAPIKRISNETLAKIRTILINGGSLEDVKALSENKIIDFPQFLDADYFYFKAIELALAKGMHIVLGKARRKGYSYKNGWVASSKIDLNRNAIVGIGAYDSSSLYPEGTMTMSDRFLQHLAKFTDWRKRRLVDRPDMIKFGYTKNDNTGIEYGYLSAIIAKSFATNNPGALRGKDGTLIFLEESGKNVLLDKVLSSTLPTLRAGILTTGLMIVFGTGGGDNKQWEAFEELFYFPSSEDFLSFNNIWDEDERGTECGLFIPTFMGKEGFFDIHGNSDVQGAIAFELRERAKRKKSRKVTKYTDYVMEEPFTPKEAFSRSKSNIFPSAQIEEQLRRVRKDPNIKAITRHGLLFRNEVGKVVFKDEMFMSDRERENMHPPVNNFPLKREDDPHGCVTIWEHPYRDHQTGLIPANLYRIEHDPFALPKDGSEVTARDSLGTCYVRQSSNNFTPGLGDKTVASWIGRPPTTNEYNDIMFMLAEYYNAMIQFENDRGDVYSYAREHELLYMLADEPEILWQQALQTRKVGRKKGLHINTTRKENGVIYLRDHLLQVRSTDEFGNKILNLHVEYDEAYLLELLRFNMKGNFDRVSAKIVGQFDKKEMVNKPPEKPNPPKETESVFNRPWF